MYPKHSPRDFRLPLALLVCAVFLLPTSSFSQGDIEDLSINEFLGDSTVPSLIAQPDLPMELRPPGVPVVQPGRSLVKATVEEQVLLPDPLANEIVSREPTRPPKLLPELEPEPGVIYIVPFTGVMVPDAVYEGIFDRFVDTMNQYFEPRGLQFVILKQGMKAVGPEWLAVRKYITGEIYSYVEDSGSTATSIRTKTRVTYHHPDNKMPAFATLLPASVFFEHDKADADTERKMLAENIATALTDKLTSFFEPELVSKSTPKPKDKGA